MTTETDPGAGRQCDICQTWVPTRPDGNEIDGIPCSLIELRWSEHGIPGLTRCMHCGSPVKTENLAYHHSVEHHLPPPSDAQLAQYNTALIRDAIYKAAQANEVVSGKLDAVLQELKRLRSRSLFWPIVAAVIAAQLLYPVVKALVVAALEFLAQLRSAPG